MLLFNVAKCIFNTKKLTLCAKSVVAHISRNFKKSPGDMVHQFSIIAQSSICIAA